MSHDHCSGSPCGSGCCKDHGCTSCHCQDDYAMPLCSCGCGKIGNCPAGDLQDAVKHAKKVLLKEKIKERLEKKMGKKLDAMADLAIEIYFGKKNMMKEKEARIDAMTSKIDDVMNAP